MMATAMNVYQRSLALLGEDLQSGAPDTAFFEERAPHFINLLLSELTELDLFMKGERFSPDRVEIPQISALEDALSLSEQLVFSLMPLGLAYLLVSEEDAARAAFFYRLYQEEKAEIRQRYRVFKRHPIREVY